MGKPHSQWRDTRKELCYSGGYIWRCFLDTDNSIVDLMTRRGYLVNMSDLKFIEHLTLSYPLSRPNFKKICDMISKLRWSSYDPIAPVKISVSYGSTLVDLV